MLSQDRAELLGKIGEINRDGVPENVRIDGIVAVDEAVSHTDHLPPGQVGAGLSAFVEHAACSLTDNFDETLQRQIQDPVTFYLPAFFGFDHPDGLVRIGQHVGQGSDISVMQNKPPRPLKAPALGSAHVIPWQC